MNKRQLRKTLRRVLTEAKGSNCVDEAKRACASNPRCADLIAMMNVTEVGEFWVDEVADDGECHKWIEDYLSSCGGWDFEPEAMVILWTVCNS